MPATIADVRADAALIGNETQIGANTASRVGGAFDDVADVLAALGITSITATADTSDVTITITQGATAHIFTLPIATATKVGILDPAQLKTIDGNVLVGSGNIDITAPILQRLSQYQKLLQSGVNIKTLEGESLLGAGNISLSSVFAAALAAYQPLLESGTNIKTINGQSLLGSGNINIEEGGQIDPTNFATLDTALGQLQYSQTPIIVLQSMGNTLDNIDTTEPPYFMYNPSRGDTYYDATAKKLTLVKGGTNEVYDPSTRVIYCNVNTNRLYRWVASNQTWQEVGSKASTTATIAATNVTYNNAESGLVGNNAQGAIDELGNGLSNVQTGLAQKLDSSALATLNGSRLDMGGDVKTTFSGTITYTGSAYTCDRTYAQLYIAYSAGQLVQVVYNGDVYSLSGSDGSTLTFTSGASEFSVTTGNAWSYAASTFAPIFSPAFTGTPTAPTANVLTSDTQIATTQFVRDAINNYASVFLEVVGGSQGGAHPEYYNLNHTWYELKTMVNNGHDHIYVSLHLENGTELKLPFNAIDTDDFLHFSTDVQEAGGRDVTHYDLLYGDDGFAILSATPLVQPLVEVAGTTPTQTLAPNTFYKFTGAVTSLTLTLGTPISGITNIYAFSFVAGAANPTISLPASVTIDGTPSIAQGDYVEFSIMNNVAFFKVVTI